MVSFGNASGPVPPVNLGILSTKGSLYVTRPTLATYIASRADLVERSNDLFEVVKRGKVKIETTERYKLADAAQAHRDLEGRKTTGSIVLPALADSYLMPRIALALPRVAIDSLCLPALWSCSPSSRSFFTSAVCLASSLAFGSAASIAFTSFGQLCAQASEARARGLQR